MEAAARVIQCSWKYYRLRKKTRTGSFTSMISRADRVRIKLFHANNQNFGPLVSGSLNFIMGIFHVIFDRALK